MIYLDNGATTYPKPECVYAELDRFAREGAVNAGRGAYRAARDATNMLKDLKTELISMVDARGQADVVLSPSATVALNQIIQGIAWKPGDVALVSPYEHNAVLRPLHLLEKRTGIKMVEIPLAEDLSLDTDQAISMIRSLRPRLCAISAVSNVTGYVQPAAEIFAEARKVKTFTLLDASQAMGLLKMRFAMLKADAVVFAGHKTLYGPFGIAGFLLKRGVVLEEFLAGGNGHHSLSLDMPRTYPEKLECASTDTVAAAGLLAAVRWLKGRTPWQTEQALMEYVLPKMREIPGITLYTAPEGAGQAGVFSFNIDGFRANEVAAILDAHHDIAVRAGHHCAALIHAHLNDKVHDGTVRVSLSEFTTRENLDALVEAVSGIDREKLKGISADILRGNC